MTKLQSVEKSNNEKKISMIGIAILILCVGIGFFIFKTFANNNDEVYITDSIVISNIRTETSDGIFNYQAELRVTENQNIDYINIKLLDDNDNEIDVLIGYVGHEVLTDEPIRIDASTDIDVSNYTKIIYEKVDINEEESINN